MISSLSVCELAFFNLLTFPLYNYGLVTKLASEPCRSCFSMTFTGSPACILTSFGVNAGVR